MEFDLLNATYESYKQELQRRGLKEQFTQTIKEDTIQTGIKQANELIASLSLSLKNSILSGLVTELVIKGASQSEISKLQSINNLDYNPVSFSLYPIEKSNKKSDLEKFENYRPNSYGYKVTF